MIADDMLRFLALPAGLFAVVYFPTVRQFSMALVSPYAKADVMRRFFAAMIDSLAVIIIVYVYSNSRSASLLVVGALYLLLRDSVRGQSPGKFFMGLVVISLETGRPCTVKDSIWRNAVLLIPGANVVAIFLESITIVRDPQGQRLGDKVAQTQVVEGEPGTWPRLSAMVAQLPSGLALFFEGPVAHRRNRTLIAHPSASASIDSIMSARRGLSTSTMTLRQRRSRGGRRLPRYSGELKHATPCSRVGNSMTMNRWKSSGPSMIMGDRCGPDFPPCRAMISEHDRYSCR